MDKKSNLHRIFWVISLDGTIYLKLQLKNVNGYKAIAIFVCFLLYFYLIANKSAIVFIVFVWWNHGTYFSSQFSFISLTNVMMGMLDAIEYNCSIYIRRLFCLFPLPICSANVSYLAILMNSLCLMAFFLLSLKLWYIRWDRKRHRSLLPVTNRQEKKINFMESI